MSEASLEEKIHAFVDSYINVFMEHPLIPIFVMQELSKNPEHLADLVRESGVNVVEDWHEADAVVTGLDFNLSYASLVGATLAVQHGATFYATNDDSTYPTAEGLYPGAGSISAVVERATGLTPIVCGKPYEPMRTLLEQYAGDHPLIVGDRADTDIALGKAEGWATALVMTGVTTDVGDIPHRYKPDIVLESLAELPAALGLS